METLLALVCIQFALSTRTQLVGVSSLPPLVVWDGHIHSVGEMWVSPAGPKSGLTATRNLVGQTRELTFRATHSHGFVEFGWQWAPWVPEFAGTDIRAYDAVELTFRVSGPHPPADIAVSLASPGGHHTTSRTAITAVEHTWPRGAWCTVFIPLKGLDTRSMKFDPLHAVQVIFGSWNGEGGGYTLHVKTIAFEKRSR